MKVQFGVLFGALTTLASGVAAAPIDTQAGLTGHRQAPVQMIARGADMWTRNQHKDNLGNRKRSEGASTEGSAPVKVLTGNAPVANSSPGNAPVGKTPSVHTPVGNTAVGDTPSRGSVGNNISSSGSPNGSPGVSNGLVSRISF
jgi:hypothetical protein